MIWVLVLHEGGFFIVNLLVRLWLALRSPVLNGPESLNGIVNILSPAPSFRATLCLWWPLALHGWLVSVHSIIWVHTALTTLSELSGFLKLVILELLWEVVIVVFLLSTRAHLDIEGCVSINV